jgi:hypothetical protein
LATTTQEAFYQLSECERQELLVLLTLPEVLGEEDEAVRVSFLQLGIIILFHEESHHFSDKHRAL